MTSKFLDNNLNNIQQNEVQIWAVDLDEFEFPCNQAVQQILSESEREKSERFRFDIIKLRYIKCHFLLRVLLGQYLGVDFYDQEFYRNQHGKPSLSGIKDHDPIFFNLSNSQNICVYVFTHEGEVGVDVEKIHYLPDMGRIVERFFSPREIEQFCSLPAHNRKKTFFKYWTRKEALIKAMGLGLSFPLDKVDVLSEQDEASGIFIKTKELNTEIDWTLQDINVFEGCASALALEGKHFDCATRIQYFQAA